MVVPPSLVFLAPVLFCKMHIHIDAPFVGIFVFSLSLISPSPGILSLTSRIFPYLVYFEDSRIGNNFYRNPKCTLSLHQPTHSGTWAFYQQEHPVHDHLLVEVTPPPQSLHSSPSNRSKNVSGIRTPKTSCRPFIGYFLRLWLSIKPLSHRICISQPWPLSPCYLFHFLLPS